MSLFGIALGVMVLITVLSVMNGFDHTIRHKIFTLVPHITVQGAGPNNRLVNWQSIENTIKKKPHIVAVEPMIIGQGMLTKDGDNSPVFINGIDPKSIDSIMPLSHMMKLGSLNKLTSGKFNIILGDQLAENLGVIPGDTVNLLIPQANITPVGVLPRFRQFHVSGIFHTGSGFGFDSSFAYINLHDAQRLYTLGNAVNALQIKLDNLFRAPLITYQLQNQFTNTAISNWTDRFGAFYHAIQMEKTMMFLILVLLIAIAAFNLVSSLMMAVREKESDIAILRTLGATPRTIMLTFIVQGGVIGLIGVILGLIAGVVLSLNVTRLANAIQQLFGVQLLNVNVYYVNSLPSRLQFSDVWHVALLAFVISLIATLYPSWRASRIEPAEALRYE